jgi:hypothetical protein
MVLESVLLFSNWKRGSKKFPGLEELSKYGKYRESLIGTGHVRRLVVRLLVLRTVEVVPKLAGEGLQ